MIIEYTTGADSLKAWNTSGVRNCSVSIYANIGDKTLPLFLAVTRKLKFVGETSIVRKLPATTLFSEASAGKWYVNRSDMAAGTELLIEVRRKVGTGFAVSTSYQLIKLSAEAALVQLVATLPPHELSALPSVIAAVGRFKIISEDSQLPESSVAVWRDHFGYAEEEGELSLIFDVNQPDEDTTIYSEELDGPLAQRVKIRAGAKVHGKSIGKITRIRRVKTRATRLPKK